ncbi:MAG TPA: hypothetical protein VKK81_18380 [Candidatus Binatia bacterium]|nr:hypothetical protein [Candidatus Binatia bacterium]
MLAIYGQQVSQNLSRYQQGGTIGIPCLSLFRSGSRRNWLPVMTMASRCYTQQLRDKSKSVGVFVEAIRLRMIQAELWTESEVLCDHRFGEGNTIFLSSFSVDLLIAQGKVVRR